MSTITVLDFISLKDGRIKLRFEEGDLSLSRNEALSALEFLQNLEITDLQVLKVSKNFRLSNCQSYVEIFCTFNALSHVDEETYKIDKTNLNTIKSALERSLKTHS